MITTATDNLGIIAPDMIAKENNFAIEDLKKAKYISSLLVDGKSVGIKDDFGVINITKGYRKINELKSIHPDINVCVSTIINIAIDCYYNHIVNEGGNQ